MGYTATAIKPNLVDDWCLFQIPTQRWNYPERFPHLSAPEFYVYRYGARVSTQQNFKQENLSTLWQVTRILVTVVSLSKLKPPEWSSLSETTTPP
jgi:hypothetical protein